MPLIQIVLSGPAAAPASLQALITAGSNSEAEMAAFIVAAHAMLTAGRSACPWAAAFAGAPAPLYVALHELPATSWGYDGRTQAARKAEREAVQAAGGAA